MQLTTPFAPSANSSLYGMIRRGTDKTTYLRIRTVNLHSHWSRVEIATKYKLSKLFKRPRLYQRIVSVED